MLVHVLRTEKLGERERKAPFPLYGKGHDDDETFRKQTKKLLNVWKARRQVSVFHNYMKSIIVGLE